jgi:hypothetical protein
MTNVTRIADLYYRIIVYFSTLYPLSQRTGPSGILIQGGAEGIYQLL